MNAKLLQKYRYALHSALTEIDTWDRVADECVEMAALQDEAFDEEWVEW